MRKKIREIKDYDEVDTTGMIDPKRRMSLSDLGFRLPPQPPTQVISIRLPTPLLNKLRARASRIDTPYQALIKMAVARLLGERL